MAIAAGTRFNQYEILAPLGAGGMGEVYRARDERLGRDVAIKVLPTDFAKDTDRLKRFEQEARATSALNHPNILTVYDFGSHEGNPYLVMELLEGEELRAQLDNGPLPIRKAIEYAQQVAAGLAAAHEKGIVHRDLKPENLFVTKDGRVKILDFGLAKLKGMSGRAGARGSVGEDDQTLPLPHAPTPPLTSPGVVMGTVGYMSPEQVRGQETDHRSDIFSFGIIMHEMLSGQRTFTGDSLVELMNAILKEEPAELSETNAKVSPQLDKIVRRCLEKKPERRFQSTSDLGFALEALPGSAGVSPASIKSDELTPVGLLLHPAGETPALPGWRDRLAWIAAGVFALTTFALGVAYFRRSALEAEPMRFAINPPEKAKLFDWPTISPDGRTLAFVADVGGKTQLWVRPLGATTARPLVEVRDNLPTPFWSADSQFIAYFDIPKLKKIAVTGGTPETLCDSPLNGGGTWNRDGVILFGGGAGGIKRISANGGAVTAITRVETARGDTVHWAPNFLPDTQHFLYFIDNPDPAKSGIYLGSLEGGETRQMPLVNARKVGIAANPADQSSGYLIFERQGALLSQPFDFSRQELVGNPMRIEDHISMSGGRFPKFSVATNGVLTLLDKEADTQLTWFDRSGQKIGMLGTRGQYSFPRLSPDGQRLAVGGTNPSAQFSDIYLFDLAGGTSTPFTFDPVTDERPIWSPDSNRVVWSTFREGAMNLFQKAANGLGQDELLLRSAYTKRAFDWSADGRFILFGEGNPQTSGDVWILPMEGARKPWPWLNTPAAENFPRFSPDGKWIAYQSNESGREEIYVQSFVPGAPASGGKRQLSTNGGTNPQWRRDGRELYYLAADGKLMAVAITPGAELKAGAPKELFAPSGFRVNADRGYTLTGDGQRFLFVTSAEDASVPPFTIVLNWMAEVKK